MEQIATGPGIFFVSDGLTWLTRHGTGLAQHGDGGGPLRNRAVN
jgi:hypothetical protein